MKNLNRKLQRGAVDPVTITIVLLLLPVIVRALNNAGG